MTTRTEIFTMNTPTHRQRLRDEDVDEYHALLGRFMELFLLNNLEDSIGEYADNPLAEKVYEDVYELAGELPEEFDRWLSGICDIEIFERKTGFIIRIFMEST